MTEVSSHEGAHGIDAAWLATLRRYFAFAIPAHLVWEIVQLPLYTIWYDDPPRRIAFAVLHCTAGDALIASVSLLGALLLVAGARWPAEQYLAVAATAITAGAAYTIFSEWHNTQVENNWSYSSLMPKLPGIGTGISPLLQWFVVPIAAFAWARPGRRKA